MATNALPTPTQPEPVTVFAQIHRERRGARPWLAFVFDQCDMPTDDQGAPILSSVGQPRADGRGQLTTFWTDTPAKLGELEARVNAYHAAGKSADDAEATVAYEELAAAVAAGSLAGIAELGYQVRGTFIPWS